MTAVAWLVAGLICMGIDVAGGGATAFVSLIVGVAMLLVAALAYFCGPLSIPIQCSAVLAFATLGLVGLRRPLAGRLHKARLPLVDEWAGVICETREALVRNATGHVALRGTLWQAKNVGEENLAPGTPCIIRRIEGITLMVASAAAEPTIRS